MCSYFFTFVISKCGTDKYTLRCLKKEKEKKKNSYNSYTYYISKISFNTLLMLYKEWKFTHLSLFQSGLGPLLERLFHRFTLKELKLLWVKFHSPTTFHCYRIRVSALFCCSTNLRISTNRCSPMLTVISLHRFLQWFCDFAFSDKRKHYHDDCIHKIGLL